MTKGGVAESDDRKYLVLHVDDEPEVWELTDLILRSCGDVTVKGAVSIAEARDIIAKEDPDLILLDLMMGGESGWDLLTMVRDELGLETPVVILTAYIDSRGNPISLRDTRFQAVLSKPYDIRSLRNVVRRFLPPLGEQ